MTGFPRLTNSAALGEAGVNLVATIVNQDFGWLFRRNHAEHDFGIDGYIDIVSDDGFVTGRCLAVQIKYGKSYVAKQQPYGFAYLGELKHFNYLANHPLPVLLLVGDPETRSFCWARFDAEHAIGRDGGWTMAIPFEQAFEKKACAALREIAGPVLDYRNALEADAAQNRAMEQAALVLCAVPRDDIEAGNTRNTVRVVERLASTAAFARANQGKLEFTVDGYWDDPREVWQIPEIVAWMKAIEPQVKYWFYFLSTQEGADEGLRTLFACVCDARLLQGVPPGPKRVPVHIGGPAMSKFLERNFIWLNEISERLSLPESKIIEISADVAACLGLESSGKEIAPMRRLRPANDMLRFARNERKRKRRARRLVK